MAHFVRLAALILFLNSIQVLAVEVQIPAVPNPKMTPGEMCDEQDPDYDSLRYTQKIAWCRRNVSFEQRQKIYEMYGIPQSCRNNYTVDHFIPLSMGGNNSPRNLWPEHKRVKALRQSLEQELHNRMNAGNIKQEEAIDAVVDAKLNPPKEAYNLTEECK